MFPLLFLVGSTVAQTTTQEDLLQPTVFESDDASKLLDITLTFEYADHVTPHHTFRNTRLFNGTLPGPTLKVKPGDKMKILFKNELTDQGGVHFENEYGIPDTANLHFHGAHVSGELPSDDVTYKVEPQREYQYETDFPDVHMPGTHWIHPHVHGSSLLQVGGGAAMALIVEDEDGTLPQVVHDAEDVLLLVQHMSINTLNNVIGQSGDGMLQIQNNGRGVDNDYRLVNGQLEPTIRMQPGEWQRWVSELNLIF